MFVLPLLPQLEIPFLSYLGVLPVSLMPLISFYLELNLLANLPYLPKNILSCLKTRTVSEISFKFFGTRYWFLHIAVLNSY